MLTPRAWLLLALDVVLLLPAVWNYDSTLTVIGLTLLAWLVVEWLIFTIRVGLIRRNLVVRRQVCDERGPVDSLWAGWDFEVNVEVFTLSQVGVSYARANDWIPFNVDGVKGDVEVDGRLNQDEPLRLRYRMHCSAPGRVRFEGVGVQFCDLHSLFYQFVFVESPHVFRVLPPMADIKGHAPTSKRHNLLPLFGIHRHRRPGSGSELLDLREYLPCDPPKTIAWKASARRDRLMTKEFESEVPVRCTLLVDVSQSVRVGQRGNNALSRLIEISSGVVQASLGARDLTGLCLFDEKTSTIVRPARGRRHLIQLLHRLADAASLAPSSAQTKLSLVLPLAYGLAYEVYPERLRNDLNYYPWYLQLWAPQPSWTMRKPTLDDRSATFMTWAAPRLIVASALLLVSTALLRAWNIGDWAVTLWGVLIVFSFFSGVALGVLGFLFHIIRALSGIRGRQYLQKKRLSALLAVRYGLGPGGLAMLLEDEERLTECLQRFLAEHQVPYPLSYYDAKGRYLFASPEKVRVLARNVLAAVGKGHDNELFVLCADLLELDDALEPLLRAIKVARARHHRILVICPWPPGVPPPSDEAIPILRSRKPGDTKWLRHAVMRAMFVRLYRAFRKLRRTFARMGVQVICAESEDSVSLILKRLDQLRVLQRGGV
jgi:uncharacterized protein (DUF58 family)